MTAIPDWTTSACFGGGFAAAECVDPDGNSWPWLLTPDGPPNGCRCPRCVDGHPCQIVVGAPGRACGWHRRRAGARR